MTRAAPRVIAIVGPTASGKSALAIRAAELLGGEIVSADSRQVYRGLDIGTAKATAEERRRVTHHLIDVADPGEVYDAARYQREACATLGDIAARGLPAIVVGGTGLYVRALLDDLTLAVLPHDPQLRAALEADALAFGGAALHARLGAIDPAAAATVDPRNVRRTIRYLEVALLVGSHSSRAQRGRGTPTTWVGLTPPRPWLDRTIDLRVARMVDEGVLDETARLADRGIDPRLPSFSAHGYVHWAAHLRGDLTLVEAVARTARDVRAYSRRQMTWYRRDRRIRWLDPTAEEPLDALRAAASGE